jgi:biotin carboxyl carrier protein
VRDDGDALLNRTGVAASDLTALLSLMARSDVIEFDLTVGKTRLSLRRAPGAASFAPVPREATADDAALAITSPLVGVFRTSLSVGDVVDAGQTIGAVEALGLPTSIDAPHAGAVEDVLVRNGTPVEYGQPLVVLRRTHAQ